MRSGPFKILQNPDLIHVSGPERDYDCLNYQCCLAMAAILNWDTFTCTGCTKQIDQKMLWKAHQNLKKNPDLNNFGKLPKLYSLNSPKDLKNV